VLLATPTPTRGLETVARRWRWLRTSLLDPYQPELHYMRGPGPKWRGKNARGKRGETWGAGGQRSGGRGGPGRTMLWVAARRAWGDGCRGSAVLRGSARPAG